MAFEPWTDQNLEPALLSTHGIAWLESSLGNEESQARINHAIVSGSGHNMTRPWNLASGSPTVFNPSVSGSGQNMIRLRYVNSGLPTVCNPSFLQIVHSLFALLFGFFGGMVAGWMSETAK